MTIQLTIMLRNRIYTSFTITSEMRIAIEYQYTDRNYNRFVTHAGGTHENKNGVLAAIYIRK
jgi:hypothetical protein